MKAWLLRQSQTLTSDPQGADGIRQSQTLTCDPQGADGVLIDCEALFQGMRSHILIKDVTPSEVKNTTVVLIFGDQP